MQQFYTTRFVNELIRKEYYTFIDTYYSDILKNPNTYITLAEKSIANYLWWGYVKLLNSWTTSLQFSLLASWVGPWDEVIIPANTYSADAIAITNIWATPVFCDINLGNFCIDIWDIRNKISPKTRAIIPVHLYGYPADIDWLMDLVKGTKISIIEDASHAFWGSSKWRKMWTLGHIWAFSTHISKNFWTLGNGGIFFTKNKDTFMKLERYIFPDNNTDEVLLSGRTPANIGVFDAIMLMQKLKIIDHVIQSNLELFSLYSQYLEKDTSITIPKLDLQNTIPHIRNLTICITWKNPFLWYWQKFYDKNLIESRGFWYDVKLPNIEKFFSSYWSLPFYFNFPKKDIVNISKYFS